MTAIVIDTSALMALLLQESDAEALLDTAARAAVVCLSAASRLELGLVAASERHGVDATDVEQLLLTLRVAVVPFDHQQLHWALAGWRRYGKGQALKAPLLFKGNDFAATDVLAALPS